MNCPKCNGRSRAVVAWCPECDPMQVCHGDLPKGFLILSPDDVESLREALAKYGRHTAGCAANYSAKPTLRNCDCGLGAALDGKKQL